MVAGGRQGDKLYLSLLFLIMGIGFLLRVVQYVDNRSLWFDEVVVVHKISHNSMGDLVNGYSPEKSLAYPVGFLAVEKLLISLFGDHEMIVRFFPFLCGVGAIVLFYFLSIQLLEKKTRLLAVALFAFSWPLIYFSVETKPYSSDVFFTLLLYVVSVHKTFSGSGLDKKSLVAFLLIGSLSILFSSPAVFVFISMGLVLMVKFLREKKEPLRDMLIAGGIFLGIFLFVYYKLVLASFIHDESCQKFWQIGFFPDLRLVGSYLSSLWKTFFNLCNYSVRFYFVWLAGVFYLLGTWSLYQRNQIAYFMLFSPVLVTFIATTGQLYPFHSRLVLFLVPSCIIVISEGLACFSDMVAKINRGVGALLLAALFVNPVSYGSKTLTQPILVEEIRPAIKYIQDNFEKGDMIYVYSKDRHAFEYYKKQLHFVDGHYLIGPSGNLDFSDLDTLDSYQRVWFLFSHISEADKKSLLSGLNRRKNIVDHFRSYGASVYLVE